MGGFKSAAELWSSEIGSALRQPQSRARVDSTLLENLSDPESPSMEEAIIQEDAFERSMETLLSLTFINSAERTILSALYNGKTKPEILTLPGVREHLKASGLTYEQCLESLKQRIQEWADSRPEGES